MGEYELGEPEPSAGVFTWPEFQSLIRNGYDCTQALDVLQGPARIELYS